MPDQESQKLEPLIQKVLTKLTLTAEGQESGALYTDYFSLVKFIHKFLINIRNKNFLEQSQSTLDSLNPAVWLIADHDGKTPLYLVLGILDALSIDLLVNPLLKLVKWIPSEA